MTRVLVIGAGSAGRRHASTLHAAGAEVDLTDPDNERAGGVLGVRGVGWGGARLEEYDGVVVASPSSAHAAQAFEALAAGARVLVEKPLATSVQDARELVLSGGDRLAVGYNLRCYEPVARFADAVHGGAVGRVLSARAWFGYWLPDWRPDVDYRTTYSARAALGGGVLDDAIHELDLLVWLVGDLSVVGAVLATVGPLELDVEDTVRALLMTADGVPVELALDYLSRRYRRGLEVVGTDATLRLYWDRRVLERETPEGIEVDHSWPEVSTSYDEQSRRFVEWVTDGRPMPVGGVEGLRSVELADRVRRAS